MLKTYYFRFKNGKNHTILAGLGGGAIAPSWPPSRTPMKPINVIKYDWLQSHHIRRLSLYLTKLPQAVILFTVLPSKFKLLKLSCDTRFQHAFTACTCVFKVITLVRANQNNYFGIRFLRAVDVRNFFFCFYLTFEALTALSQNHVKFGFQN